MKIIRLYAAGDRKSHREEIELKFGGNQPCLGYEPHVFMTVPLAD